MRNTMITKVHNNYPDLKMLAALFAICISGCVSNDAGSGIPNPDGYDNAVYYSLEHPISLNPAITSAMNSLNMSDTLGFDSDLLGLANSITKVQTFKLTAKGSSIPFIANTDKFRTTFDTVMYASYPVDVLAQDKKNSFSSVTVVPLIGAGVRVVADYTSAKGELSLAAFGGEIENVSGSVQIQLLGVNRLGANGSGFSQFNLTPESIAIMKEQVSNIMAQMWLKNTIIQPKIVGFTVLTDRTDLVISPAILLPKILEQVPSLSDYFFETQLMELYQLGKIDAGKVPEIRKAYVDAKVASGVSHENYIMKEMIRILVSDRHWDKSIRTTNDIVKAVMTRLPNLKFNCIASETDWKKINTIIHEVINGLPDQTPPVTCS